MVKGDIVMIYQDPVTRQKPEGEAVLFELISQDEDFERWGVVFVPTSGLEDPDRTVYERNIAVNVAGEIVAERR